MNFDSNTQRSTGQWKRVLVRGVTSMNVPPQDQSRAGSARSTWERECWHSTSNEQADDRVDPDALLDLHATPTSRGNGHTWGNCGSLHYVVWAPDRCSTICHLVITILLANLTLLNRRQYVEENSNLSKDGTYSGHSLKLHSTSNALGVPGQTD